MTSKDTALLAEIEALRAEVARCHARLEIDHHFVMSSDGDGFSRVDVPYEERDLTGSCDGIDARDCTIMLQDAENDSLIERLRASEAETTELKNRIAVLEKAVGDISRQKLLQEMSDEDLTYASFEDAYEGCVKRARAALEPSK